MKIPMPPPPFEALLKKLGEQSTDRLVQLISWGYEFEAASQPYSPWDKLRHKTPPDGTHPRGMVAHHQNRSSRTSAESFASG